MTATHTVTVAVDEPPVDLDEYFGDHPEFRKCRRYGHAMDETHDGYIVNGAGPSAVWEVHLECLRCTCGRIDIFDQRGEFVRRKYKRPEGYDIEGGRLSRWDVCRWDQKRAEQARREQAAKDRQTRARTRPPRKGKAR